MCLLLISWKTDPRYPLILAGNRDEFYNRPTRPLHKWESKPVIAAGRDLKSRGTWLAVSENRRFAAVTNFRNPATLRENVRSRGELVTKFLLSSLSTEKILEKIRGTAGLYNGFNLILGDGETLWYLNEMDIAPKEIPPGIHVISNARLNTPWPKAVHAKSEFSTLIAEENFHPDPLFKLLLNDQTYPTSELPSTGVTPEMEKQLSSLFIRMPGYGTRSSAVISLDQNGVFSFSERTYQKGDTASFLLKETLLPTLNDR